MDIDSLVPIVAIIATAWVAVTVMNIWFRPARARAGDADSDSGTGTSVADAKENARLAHENETLRLTSRRLEERIAVLERIATDPAERTAREIEELR